MSASCRLSACLVAGLLTAAAWADPPDVVYLSPESFTGRADAPSNLRIERGAAQRAAVAQWPADDLSWFFVRGSGTQKNLPTVQADADNGRAVTVEDLQPGVSIVGINIKPTIVELTGREWAAFVKENVAAGTADVRDLARQNSVRVRHVQSAKTLIQVLDADGKAVPSGVGMGKTGQAVEIRPLYDPVSLEVGADFPLRVYALNSKRAGAKVKATSLAGNATESKTTNPTGVTFFRITHPGVWRIEFHHAEPVPDDPAADWVLYSGTLTFEVSAEGGAK